MIPSHPNGRRRPFWNQSNADQSDANQCDANQSDANQSDTNQSGKVWSDVVSSRE